MQPGLDNTMILSINILILITNAGGVNDTTTDYSGEDHMETKCTASVVPVVQCEQCEQYEECEHLCLMTIN